MSLNDMFDKLGNFMMDHGKTIEKVLDVVEVASSLIVEPALVEQSLDQINQKYENLENAPRIEAVSQLSTEEYAEYSKEIAGILQDYQVSILEDAAADELEEQLEDEYKDLIAGLDITDGDFTRIDPNEINDIGSGKVR